MRTEKVYVIEESDVALQPVAAPIQVRGLRSEYRQLAMTKSADMARRQRAAAIEAGFAAYLAG